MLLKGFVNFLQKIYSKIQDFIYIGVDRMSDYYTYMSVYFSEQITRLRCSFQGRCSTAPLVILNQRKINNVK